MNAKKTWCTWAILGTFLFGIEVGQASEQACPEPGAAKTYTSTEDFNPIHPDFYPGEPVRNNTIGEDGELGIVSSPATLPYIWVACSLRGTVVRIATEQHYCPIRGGLVNPGDVLGEYQAAPDGCYTGGFPYNDPSRVTVDFDGNAWVGNRLDIGAEGPSYVGHIVKIGTGLAHQWVDRNGNGVLDTSMGLGDIRPWPGPPDHFCGSDDVAAAEDELILLYQTVPSTGTRTLAPDRDNNIWIGGHEYPHYHGLLDGRTGEVLEAFEPMDCGGYAGLVDCSGVLWSARGMGSGGGVLNELLRYEVAGATSECIELEASYGLAVDLNGYIWNSRREPAYVTRIPPDGEPPFAHYYTRGQLSRGVAVTWADNDVWVANSDSDDITRFANDGAWLGKVNLYVHGGQYPTGVAVDSAGMVWVTNDHTNNVMVIDPTLGDFGEVVPERTVELGSGARPYNYSDMTGVSLLWTTAPAGVWTAACEGPEAGTVWQKLDWNATAGAGSVRVQVRAADWDYDLGKELYVDVEDDVPFGCAITGKYLQIRVVLSTECGAEPWPTLQDLTVYACEMIDCNENDVADYCECPEPILFDADPPNWAIDARKPYPPTTTTPCYGFGMPDDPGTVTKDESTFYPIIIDIGVAGAGDPACWVLCETPDVSESDCGSNYIDDVVDNLDGTYRIELHHGVQAGTVTTIQYLGDLIGASYVEYIHHPANVDGSGSANNNDIIVVVDCLNYPGTCENYEADVDASGQQTSNDIVMVIDLLNGADSYDPWYNTDLPENNGACPVLCEDWDGQGGREAGEGGGDGGRELLGAPEAEEEEQPFGPWFAGYLLSADPVGEAELAEFIITVEALTGWCAAQLSPEEKRELIVLLHDPEAEFANPGVEALVPRIVAGLQ